MEKKFPLEFKLEDGTQVVVKKTDNHLYDFTLNDEENGIRHFTLNDEEEFTDEKEKALDFDQLNALRRFWLETRNED
jgi:hypothetical protein